MDIIVRTNSKSSQTSPFNGSFSTRHIHPLLDASLRSRFYRPSHQAPSISWVNDPQVINLREIVQIINVTLHAQGPLLLPRISPFPILRVRWTFRGPLLILLTGHSPSGQKAMFLFPTLQEWRSLIQVTGALSTYIRLRAQEER